MAECSLNPETTCLALTEAHRQFEELKKFRADDRQVLKATRDEWAEREHKLHDQLKTASQTIATLTCDLSVATATVDALRKTNIGLIAERDSAESLRYAAQKYSKEAFERGRESMGDQLHRIRSELTESVEEKVNTQDIARRVRRARDDALGKNKELAEIALKFLDKGRDEMAVELAEARERIKREHQLIRDIHNALICGVDARSTTLEVAISVRTELAEAKAQIKALERQRAERVETIVALRKNCDAMAMKLDDAERARDEALKAVDRLTRPGEHTAVIDDLRKTNAQLLAERHNAESSRAAAWEVAKESFAKGRRDGESRIDSIRRWLTPSDEEGVSTEDVARRVGDELRTAKTKIARLQALRPDLAMTDITVRSCRKLAAYDAIKELVARAEVSTEGKNVDGTV